ncbi:hypothetical protein [Rubeoparvulum massiliense]|uniref:hypothetical protein n=1 Tax=Rubeoparvulum massiliense TaxID=1631346 RepID=UPI00065E384A|nr:hypothetical protein [Rubeoparvulum massiliense]
MKPERWIADGVAFLPVNLQGLGDVTRLYYIDGQEEICEVPVQHFFADLTQIFGIDASLMRKRYGRLLGKSQLIPIPFSYEWTLLPLKVRSPIGRQSCYGWFLAQEIQRIEEVERLQTHVFLTGGHRIPILHPAHTIRERIRDAMVVQYQFQLLHQRISQAKERNLPYSPPM